MLEGGRSAELARARKLGNGSLVLCLAGHPSCIIILFRLLVKLEAVQLSVQQTAEALKVAALWSCEDAVTRLCALPAAGFLSSKQLAAALEASVMPSLRRGSMCSRCRQRLCQLPAAQQLDKKQVERLLATAQQSNSIGCVAELRHLPAAVEHHSRLFAEMVTELAAAGLLR